MELFIHVIMLIGGLAVWTSALLIAFGILYMLIVGAAEFITKKELYPIYVPWVHKLRAVMLVIWITIAFLTSAYYGMRVDVQLTTPTWAKGFYEEVTNGRK